MIIDGIEADSDAASGFPITVLAYGDSWFDYPVNDLLRAFNLAMHDAPVILTRARGGNEMIKDIASRSALADIRLDLRSYGWAEAVLLSGGGNDFSGEDGKYLKTLLRADCSAAGGAAECFDDAAVATRMAALMDAYRRVLDLTEGIRPGLPVLAHTYDYAWPSGKGLLWLGPWLKPALDACNVPERLRDAVINRLIDRFKAMLEQLQAERATLHVIDLTYTLDKPDWSNELHPTPGGFRRLGERYAAKYSEIVG
jgi:hypothetical protein